MFLLNREYKIHIHPTRNELALTRTPMKTTWRSAPWFWLLPHNNKQMNENTSMNYTYIALPLLHKYNIPSHIQSSHLKNYDKIQSNPKTNKGALQQASTLFSTNAPPLQPTWSYTTPLPTITYILNPNLPISKPMVSQSTPSLAPRPLLLNGGTKNYKNILPMSMVAHPYYYHQMDSRIPTPQHHDRSQSPFTQQIHETHLRPTTPCHIQQPCHIQAIQRHAICQTGPQ